MRRLKAKSHFDCLFFWIGHAWIGWMITADDPLEKIKSYLLNVRIANPAVNGSN